MQATYRLCTRLCTKAVPLLLVGAISLSFVDPAQALTITPTFGSSITGDPNAAAIEASINSTIAIYENTFTDPINVPITFNEMTSGLGQSSVPLFSVPYATYRAALGADATTANDATALAGLPNQANNPVTRTASMLIKPATADAVGGARSLFAILLRDDRVEHPSHRYWQLRHDRPI
jgi:hypothetical protein